MEQSIQEGPDVSQLQTNLLTIKHASDPTLLFPSQAFGRGGVGQFLCTGQSRVGLHRLPQASSQAASLSLTARGRLDSSRSLGSGGGGSAPPETGSAASHQGSSLTGFSLISADPMSVGATRAWEAGTAQHTHNFVASSRTVRPRDQPGGSKWAAVSFYENDPREVARHMAIMDVVQAQHEANKAAERQAEQARHNLWAEQQRETFRRQRLEQAARYARSGMRPRSAYAELGALAAAEAAHAAASADASPSERSLDGGAGGGGSTAPASLSGGLPDPTHRFFSTAAQARATLSMPGSAGSLHGRLRPSTALPAGSDAASAFGRAGGPGAAAYAATLYQAGALAGTAGIVGLRSTPIPLPKKTYVQVYDRMAAEANETPSTRAAAVAAAKARVEDERQQAVLAGEMQELELFEARMRSLQRARSKASRLMDPRRGSHPYGDDDG
ncbi:hypothetical protein GPECTOR_44g35 [Gonium pectorale]|uniref:Uncharacterized protein n=1 Tax=Gonium pectorale TaxID=33097 RepID=A0A150G935_GONPE|nr:hypothetical protein GPECTOR_44g35 [Gonium pectorale]|eukprot:KXZ46357.1 hypothetical protein GPECTOR_44g35 [Gonium pectorale]